MDVSALRRQHDEIGLTARLLRQTISDDRLPRSVAGLRWQLARQLMAHLALEDGILYPALERSLNRETRERAIALRKETGALADRFSIYLATWSDDRIADEWSGFCAETRQILDALDARIEGENRLLYPLVDAEKRAPPQAARRA